MVLIGAKNSRYPIAAQPTGLTECPSQSALTFISLHTMLCQFIHHSFTRPLHAQNSPVPQILPTTDC